MLGGRNKQPLGYTIVEVMIVLAVSGVMLLIASQFINGKQAKTSFTQGVNDIAARLQQTINDVADGQYSDVSIDCQAVPGGLQLNPGTGDTQGRQSGCVFMGKMYYFYNNGTPTPQNYEIFSLVGARIDPVARTPVTTLAGSYLKPVDGRTSQDPADPISFTVKDTVPQGLSVGAMTCKNCAETGQIYTLGFVQSLGTLDPKDATGKTYQSGSQTINLMYASSLVGPTGPNQGPNGSPSNQAATLITGTTLASAGAVNICRTDGSRYAIVTVGNNSIGSGELPLVSVKMYGERAACPVV